MSYFWRKGVRLSTLFGAGAVSVMTTIPVAWAQTPEERVTSGEILPALKAEPPQAISGPGDSGTAAPAPQATITGVVVEGGTCATAAAADPNPLGAKPAFIPRPGFFGVPPTGPGYYSLLDMLNGNYREKPPTYGYPRFAVNATPFFDADFRYVDKAEDPDFLEQLHRIHVGEDWLLATGGEFRFRYFNEVNSRLSGKDNVYDLMRVRVFGDIWYQDKFRVFVEGITAQDFRYNPKLAPLLIDRNNGDLLNAFVDVKLLNDMYDVPWYVRAGRQELVLGSQRLISGLDWANTLRTFDGVRAFRHGEKFDVDVFWSRPVIPNPSILDQSDPRQNFAGVWTEYRPTKTQALDIYYLYLDNTNTYSLATKTPAPVGQFPVAPYNVSTIGYRYSGNAEFNKKILFDSENAIQFGHSNFAHSGLFAGASTTGLGYNFSEVPMNPTVWAYFDYASGSADLKAGQQSTFNQLYPFGHYYFGGIDYFGRQNIMDLNFHGYLYPTNWLTLNAQLHLLQLSSATDALYNAGGQILRYDPTGKAGRNLGQELSFVANFHISTRQDIFLAYAHLFEGDFLKATGPGSNAETFWFMYNFRW